MNSLTKITLAYELVLFLHLGGVVDSHLGENQLFSFLRLDALLFVVAFGNLPDQK